ncbi:SUKH-4 family immunity protein [Streptomyces sp. NPDC016309]|uniref:SUKH-4 family immunity protein n=1 Tax=Streptomyces sp. NPDC016309 TaxID=3364965 RepID=UPI0036F947A6
MNGIHPGITHGPTRRRLAEAGPPRRPELVRLTRLAEGRVVTAAQLVPEEHDAAELDPYIAGLLAVGHLPVETLDAQDVVVDGETGRVFTLEMYAPWHAEILPLAPSLEVLDRLLEAVDALDGRRGRFADLAGRWGVETAQVASERLLSVFTELGGAEWEGPLPALWRIAALIRPMALVARPGRGLLLDLPPGFIEDEFGAGEVVRLDPARLPAALEHEPTRRFLAEVGLPRDGLMFEPADPETLLETVRAERARLGEDPALRHLCRGDRLPPDADRLLVLGGLIHDLEVVVDGRTGTVHYLEYGAGTPTPVNADVSTLAFTLWMHHREQAIDKEHRLTEDFYHQLADAMVAVLASVDPVACLPASGPDDYRYWPEVFHDQAGDVL